jgi:hypothetical protein
MAQTARTTNTLSGQAALQTRVTNLKAKFAAGVGGCTGTKILATDIVEFINIYNTWIAHTHNVQDWISDGYGSFPWPHNEASRETGIPVSTVTGAGYPGIGAGASTALGEKALVSEHNTYVNTAAPALNQDHNHLIDDQSW